MKLKSLKNRLQISKYNERTEIIPKNIEENMKMHSKSTSITRINT